LHPFTHALPLFFMTLRPPSSTLFPYTTLFRSISLTGMYLLRLFRQRDPFVAMDDFRPGDVRGPQGLFAGQPADAVHLAGGVPDDPASDDAAVFGGHFRDVAGAKIADDPDDAGGEQA